MLLSRQGKSGKKGRRVRTRRTGRGRRRRRIGVRVWKRWRCCRIVAWTTIGCVGMYIT